MKKRKIKNFICKGERKKVTAVGLQKISRTLPRNSLGKGRNDSLEKWVNPGQDVRLVGEAKKRFPFSIECKWQESWSLPSWIKQAKENQGGRERIGC